MINKNIYGLYMITMSDGFKIKVNASGLQSAYESIIKASIVNAPISAVKSCKLIKQIERTNNMGYFRPNMTYLQIHNIIKQVFTMAYITKPHHMTLNSEFKAMKEEINTRQKSGGRRYPVCLSGYVQGVFDTLYNDVQNNSVEFCYLYKGLLYSTHKRSNRLTTERLHHMQLDQDEWQAMPNGFIWKESNKVFSGF